MSSDDVWRWTEGATLPDAALTWLEWDGDVIPFAAGHTFLLEVAEKLGDPPLFTKTSGITGANVAPNITVTWLSAGEITTLAPGTYVVEVTATRTSDGKKRIYKHLPLIIGDGIG